MAGFLYFMPNHRGPISPAILAEFGLSHIVDQGDKTHGCECVANGPGGQPGMTVGRLGSLTHEEIRQSDAVEWVRFPKPHAAKQAWLGWYKDRPMPTPLDLARKVQLPGETITLADGHKWLVPIARDFEGACKVPRCFDLDEETGGWVPSKVRSEYAKLWAHAVAVYTAQMEAIASLADGEDSVRYTIPDDEALVADSLAANYRVSARELATLGVLASGLVQDIASIIIGQYISPTDAADAKKKLDQPDGRPSPG